LAATGEYRDPARLVTGVSNLLFGCIILSGSILWLPRKWSWRHVRPVLWFRGGLQGKARDFNWHNVIGLWCALPLLAVVAAGLVISFPWATNLVYTLTGTKAPAAAPTQQRGGGAPGVASLDQVDGAWRLAQVQVPGWRVISLRLPQREADPFTFTIDRNDERGRPDLRHVISIDSKAERVSRAESFDSYNTGRKARTWLRWIHTGEAGGAVGQAIAGGASAGGAVLVWTGLALALRRFRTWRTRKETARASLVNSDLRENSQSAIK
jgi:uncharacterized iron-regulated membrane protein